MRNAQKILVGKPKRKRTLERPGRRLKDNIMTDFRDVGSASVDWIYLAQDRDLWRAFVNTVMKLRVL
jgi:hypothetical protein